MTLMSRVDLERICALVVDDNAHMRHLVKTILVSIGIRDVREANDGADALFELRNVPANLLIADWNMEPLDGMDLVRLVRNSDDSPNPYIPFLMMTGHATMENIIAARDAGVDEFVSKPISAKSLLGKILAIVNNPRIFVNTPKYFGPDRRRKIEPCRSDRRVEELNLVSRPEQFGLPLKKKSM